jgi:hypothetical protein
VVIVCKEQMVLNAFNREKQAMLKTFNATLIGNLSRSTLEKGVTLVVDET